MATSSRYVITSFSTAPQFQAGPDFGPPATWSCRYCGQHASLVSQRVVAGEQQWATFCLGCYSRETTDALWSAPDAVAYTDMGAVQRPDPRQPPAIATCRFAGCRRPDEDGLGVCRAHLLSVERELTGAIEGRLFGIPRPCLCADPENCREAVPGYACRRQSRSAVEDPPSAGCRERRAVSLSGVPGGRQ